MLNETCGVSLNRVWKEMKAKQIHMEIEDTVI